MTASTVPRRLAERTALATFLALASGIHDAGAQVRRSTVVPASAPAPAVSTDSLIPGGRYRITLAKLPDRIGPQFPDERRLVGVLVSVHGDSLLLRPHPLTSVVAVPYAAIDGLERSRGVSRVASALENAVGGALIGVLVGSTLYDHGLDRPNFATRGRSIGTSAAFLASIGFITGALFPVERWKRVDRPTGSSVAAP